MGDTLTTLISEELIDERVGELAAQIDEDYRTAGDLVLIGVLKGSFIFLADLTRRLTILTASSSSRSPRTATGRARTRGRCG